MRRLIVNADDFGLTPGVNRAIIEAHTRGIVTSATLMANMPAFDEAVELAKAHPRLGIGLHFNLTQGRPLAPPHLVRSLINPHGEFLGTSTKLAGRWAVGQLRSKEVIVELRAQIEALLNAGLTVTHVDSHKHAHALPPIWKILSETLSSYGIQALRRPHERLRWGLAFGSPKLFKQSLTATALGWLSANNSRRTPAHAVCLTDAFFGVAQTGFWSQAWLLNLLAQLPAGTSELMCHPGYDDGELEQAQTRLRASRETELRLLIDPEICVAVTAQNIELVHFGQLKPAF
jgi:chitin disaccharide deacetylase